MVCSYKFYPEASKIYMLSIFNDLSLYSLGLTTTDEMLKAAVTNVGNRSRVANVMKKALRGENITIATIGGSITEGTGISPADGRAEKCWAALMAMVVR